MGKPESEASDFVPLHEKFRDGRSVTIRCVRADDAERMRAALGNLCAEALYSRFLGAVKVTPTLAEHAVQPLAGGQRALVAVAGTEETIVGGARYVDGADHQTCEFAVAIADSWRRMGLASSLLRILVRDACAHGLTRMEGYVLATNGSMLDLARRLDFEVRASDEGPLVKLVRLDLVRARIHLSSNCLVARRERSSWTI